MDRRVFRYSHTAMATTFETTICGVAEEYARKAAKAGYRTMDVVEASLSRFREDSDIARINRLKVDDVFRPSIHCMECLAVARRVWLGTGGAFDPTIGTLLRWRTQHLEEEPIPPEVLSRAGMDKLRSTESHNEVSVTVEGLSLDLGAIGKGYGVDCAAELLRGDWDISTALIQGGESSMRGWGAGIDGHGWPIAIRNPRDQKGVLAEYWIQDYAISGSGQLLHGSHILDPRSGRFVAAGHAAWSCSPTATEADALSTALMIMNGEEAERYFRANPDSGGLILKEDGALVELGAWGRRGVVGASDSE